MNTLDQDEHTFDELKERLEQSAPYMEDVSSGKRFVNYIIDMVAWYIIAMVLMVAIIFFTHDQSVVENKGYSYMITFISLLSYYIFFEGLTGQTIGKMITKTKVVNGMGEKPTLSQIVGRSFARLIPFDAFSFLGGGAGWHDTLAGTRVVSAVAKNINELV